MIHSNNINVRNLISKEVLYSGVLSDNKVETIDTSNIDHLILYVYAKNVDKTSAISVRRTGGFTGAIDSPDVLDSTLNKIKSKVITLIKDIETIYYIDVKALNSIQIVFTSGEGKSDFELAIKKIPFSLSPVKDVMNYKVVIESGGVVNKPLGRMHTKGYKYAIIESEGYNIINSAHFFVRLETPLGDIYPDVMNVEGSIVSYGNGQVRFGNLGVKRYYIDLLKYNADYIDIGVSLTPNFSGNVLISALTNSLENLNDLYKEVLFEGEKFKFEKINDLNDVYNGWFTSTNNSQHLVYLSNDVKNKSKHIFNLFEITKLEKSNLRYSYIIPFDENKVNTSKDFRVMVVLQNGTAYVNKAVNNELDSWVKCNAWETSGTNRKIPVKNLNEEGGIKRFDPTLPERYYSYNNTYLEGNGVTFIQFQDNFNVNFLGGLCRTKKLVIFGSYLTTGERIGIWTTTDGGLNWVLTYDFINTYLNVSDSINTSQLSKLTEKVTVKKINVISPSDENKDPIDKFTFMDIGDFVVENGEKTYLKLNNHGLTSRDLILISSVNNEQWKFLKCDSFSTKKITQNIYIIDVVDDNTIEIKMYRGSYDTGLMCRHVHSINEHVGGLIVSTGEEHPNGWFLYISQKFKDGSSVVDAFRLGRNNVFRLNSSKNGIQRACGFLMDNATDPNILFNCDTSNPNLGSYEVKGRSVENLPLRSSNGIWKGKLSDIDDWGKFECILPMPEPGIWMHQLGDIIVAYYQLGSNAISVDGGKTWEVFQNGTNAINGIWNNAVVIGNGYMFKWK
ncbi:hypothetical protein HMPREF9714_03349 [Myroides odoratimimus CCUG 12901]|uniref:hypothetical protein n=1 Tax=Myroides odoratimimus TaxID=76832 RepID=UPI0002461155|nr:hypothetical protein [Myroides odoratimimus]EHO05411.1 hypothetical protein HMPREF9714_03349 [Myroides odoratimimus CCUG 12901]